MHDFDKNSVSLRASYNIFIPVVVIVTGNSSRFKLSTWMYIVYNVPARYYLLLMP